MKITKKNQPTWAALYEAAKTYRDFKPWNHFDDSYIFGIKDPVSGDIGWCVIMGDGEILYGLVVYIGDEGFEKYQQMLDLFGMGEEINIAIDQTCLKVEFVNSNEIEDVDKEIYKQLGLKYRGKNQYPVVRRNDPGLFPWPVDETQAAFLTHCLEQSVNVVQQALDAKITISEMDSDELLVMVPETERGKIIEWEPVYIDVPDPADSTNYTPDPFLVNRVKRELKKKDATLFLSFQYLMNPVQQKKGERAFFPRLALWVDGENGLIMANNLYPPGDIWNQFQKDFIEVLNNLGYIPESIGVDSSMGIDLIDLYSVELGIELVFTPDHPLFLDLSETLGDFF